jgi:hypothetical protein
MELPVGATVPLTTIPGVRLVGDQLEVPFSAIPVVLARMKDHRIPVYGLTAQPGKLPVVQFVPPTSLPAEVGTSLHALGALPHQIEGYERLRTWEGSGLFQWDMGCGKTRLGLMAAAGTAERVLIVTPVADQWVEEAKRVLGKDYPIQALHRDSPWRIEHVVQKAGFEVSERLDDGSWTAWRPYTARGFKGLTDRINLGTVGVRQIEADSYWTVTHRTQGTHRYATKQEAEQAVAAATVEPPVPDHIRVVVCSWAIFPNRVAEWLLWNPAVLIVDEAHRGKGHRNKLKDASGNYSIWKTTQAATMARMAEYVRAVILLTGTPDADRGGDFWSLFHAMDAWSVGSFKQFTAHYWGAFQGEYGWNTRTPMAMHTDELKARLPCYLHRVRKEDIPNFPKQDRRVIWVEREALMPSTAGYRGSMRDLGGDEDTTEDDATRLAWFASLKTGLLAQRIYDCVVAGERVFALTGFHRSVEDLAKALVELGLAPGQVLHGHGGTHTQAERRELAKQLRTIEGGSVLVGTIGAFGEAIDGLQWCNRTVVGCMPWEPKTLRQLEGRRQRLGGIDGTVEYILVRGSIEEIVFDVNITKIEAFAAGTGDPTMHDLVKTLDAVDDKAALNAFARRLLANVVARSPDPVTGTSPKDGTPP